MKRPPRYADLTQAPLELPHTSLLTAILMVARRLWRPIEDAWWDACNLTWRELV